MSRVVAAVPSPHSIVALAALAADPPALNVATKPLNTCSSVETIDTADTEPFESWSVAVMLSSGEPS